MKLYNLRRTMAVSAFGLAALLGASGIANAQDNGRHRRQPPPQQQQEERQEQKIDRRQDRIETQRRTIEQQRLQIEQQRQREEQIRLQTERSRNYNYNNNRGYNNNNGYYGNRYRVYRNGGYYNTDSRGAELLRQAVNNGYEQGVRAGQADRYNRRGGNYRNNSVYRSGNYGYQSYVDASQYQYYFQQGFDRGYQDGYNGRYQYGTNSGGAFNILGSILSGILNLQSY